MKKLLSAALVACFALTVCVGCGDSSTTKKSTGATISTNTAGGMTKKEETKSGAADGAKPDAATPPK